MTKRGQSYLMQSLVVSAIPDFYIHDPNRRRPDTKTIGVYCKVTIHISITTLLIKGMVKMYTRIAARCPSHLILPLDVISVIMDAILWPMYRRWKHAVFMKTNNMPVVVDRNKLPMCICNRNTISSHYNSLMHLVPSNRSDFWSKLLSIYLLARIIEIT